MFSSLLYFCIWIMFLIYIQQSAVKIEIHFFSPWTNINLKNLSTYAWHILHYPVNKPQIRPLKPKWKYDGNISQEQQ